MPASTTNLGTSKASVAPANPSSPIFVGDNDTRLSYYAADTGTANTYVITPSPAQTAYTTGQILSFKVGNANSGTSTLNVNGLGAKTIKKNGSSTNLVSGDLLVGQIVVVEYDGTNFQLISEIGPAPAQVKFGGTGADGALSITSGTTTIDCANAAVVVKNYTSISITGTGKLAFSNPNSHGTIVTLKSQGDVVLTSSTAPMIDMSGMGATAGLGGTSTVAASSGTTGYTYSDTTTSAGSASGPGVGGLGGGAFSSVSNLAINFKIIKVATGGGGGGGGYSNATGQSGDGGRGGGGLYIECAGALNFTTASGISVAGLRGANSSGSGGNAGGGGGGGGVCVVLYNTLTASSGTITASGGAGGTGNPTTGQAGSDGLSLIAANTEFN